LLRASLAIHEKLQSDIWERFATLSSLGEVLVGQHKYAAAEPALLQGYEGLQRHEAKIPGNHRQLTLEEAVKCIVRLYDKTEQAERLSLWAGRHAGKLPVYGNSANLARAWKDPNFV